MRLELVTAPATTPVSLTEVREWIAAQSGVTEDDSLLTALIDEVTDLVESYTGRALVQQTWRIYLDATEVDHVIYLPKAPLISVGSVTVYDSEDTSSTVSSANYQVRAGEDPRIALKQTVYQWADDLRSYDCMEIVADFGYATVPARIKHLLKGLILHAYATKGLGVIEFSSGQLMSIPQQYRQMLRNLKLRVAL